MTTSNIALLTACLVTPLLLGFAFPRHLRFLIALGALALIGNWVWRFFFKPVTADMPVWLAALLGVIASLVALAVCAGCVPAGSRARRRFLPLREHRAA